MLFAVDCEKGKIPYHSRNMILLRNEWVCDCVKMSKCEMYLGVPFSVLPSINHTRRRYYVRRKNENVSNLSGIVKQLFVTRQDQQLVVEQLITRRLKVTKRHF